jgi:tRNA (guanine37-N1)-methyltransferase
MNISILTLFPQLYEQFLKTSLIGRACDRGLLKADMLNLFEHCPAGKRIDAPTFGHSSGVLLRPELVAQAIDDQEIKYGKALKIFFSPHGTRLTQPYVRDLAMRIINSETQHVLLVASRYEGMDARVEQVYADEIISLGDYVLMGGDLPTMVFIETLLRYVPGIVGKQESVEKDSFSGPLVDHPEYTVPVEWRGMKVPEVVRSGNHAAIDLWHQEKAAERTVKHHFTWLRSHVLNKVEKALVAQFIPSHYVVLMHDEVRLKAPDESERVGTTSVTTLDIHDIARSSATFGVKNFFIVTPLVDQQNIVRTLLDFWMRGAGYDYNPHRFQAISGVKLCNGLDDVIKDIAEREGKIPLIIATSARSCDVADESRVLTYDDQEIAWSHDRPILIVLGTGQGLASSVLKRADYLLDPIVGLSDFNHLSVRSAAAIIFDRWIGLKRVRRTNKTP